jgi:hypothetical protein
MLPSDPFTFIRRTVDNLQEWPERFSKKVADVLQAGKGSIIAL